MEEVEAQEEEPYDKKKERDKESMHEKVREMRKERRNIEKSVKITFGRGKW